VGLGEKARDQRIMTKATFEEIAKRLDEEYWRQDHYAGRYDIQALIRVAKEADGSDDTSIMDESYYSVEPGEMWRWIASPDEIATVTHRLKLGYATSHDFYRICIECELTPTHIEHIHRAIIEGTYDKYWRIEDKRDDRKLIDAFRDGAW
jgi:hypothetical protein